jgi:hypothetical protein
MNMRSISASRRSWKCASASRSPWPKATKKAARLRLWLAAAETVHRGHILRVTIEIAHRAGELLYRAVAVGMAPSAEDAIIAATASVNGFTVLSRNVRDMKALYANWSNPLEVIPPDSP